MTYSPKQIGSRGIREPLRDNNTVDRISYCRNKRWGHAERMEENIIRRREVSTVVDEKKERWKTYKKTAGLNEILMGTEQVNALNP
jgi:hypothetical protein